MTFDYMAIVDADRVCALKSGSRIFCSSYVYIFTPKKLFKKTL